MSGSTTKRRRSSESSQHDGEPDRPSKITKGVSHIDTAPVLPEIASLLDFTSLSSAQAISSRFDDIANALLRDYQLVVTNGGVQTTFQILEMEFYLQKPGDHEDPFTHGSEEQKRSGQWYFHRTPRYFAGTNIMPTDPGGYRSGSRKGLDLTFGTPVKNGPPAPNSSGPADSVTRGGILLRTLRRRSDHKLISGPSLLADEILRLSGASSIAELVDQKWCGDISAWPDVSADRQSSLRLERNTGASPLKPPLVYRSPRIGLDLSHFSTTESLCHPRVVYVSKPYRYFIHPNLLTANGRVQTFLGVYNACRASGRNTNNAFGLRREIIRMGGFSQKIAEKYLADYKDGLKSGSLKTFIGARGKGTSSSTSGCLKMFGTLARLQETDTDG